MEIIETPTFTRLVQALLSEEEYRLLQIAIIQRPESGDLIPGSGGLRKKRWSLSGRGITRWCAGHILLGCGAWSDIDAIDLFEK